MPKLRKSDVIMNEALKILEEAGTGMKIKSLANEISHSLPDANRNSIRVILSKLVEASDGQVEKLNRGTLCHKNHLEKAAAENDPLHSESQRNLILNQALTILDDAGSGVQVKTLTERIRSSLPDANLNTIRGLLSRLESASNGQAVRIMRGVLCHKNHLYKVSVANDGQSHGVNEAQSVNELFKTISNAKSEEQVRSVVHDHGVQTESNPISEIVSDLYPNTKETNEETLKAFLNRDEFAAMETYIKHFEQLFANTDLKQVQQLEESEWQRFNLLLKFSRQLAINRSENDSF